MILAYVVRHGSTAISPEPEGWLQIPLSPLGRAQAIDAAQWLKQNAEQQIGWGVSSDLTRAIETLAICSKVLKMEIVKPLYGLRAFNVDAEKPTAYEARTQTAFAGVLAAAKASKRIPLIAWHRSGTAWLVKTIGGVLQDIDYREAAAVREGGIIEISTERGAVPVYKTLDENARENLDPSDGTHISGFVTADVNHEPRNCGNCKWLDKDHCEHPVTNADDELGLFFGRKRNAATKWLVEATDCCNSFQHKIGTA